MRVRTGMVLAALLLTAGCGAEPARAGCVDGGGEVTVTAADNGHRICLDRHGTVRVSLQGRPTGPVSVSGTGLARESDDLFRGESTGTAVLTSAFRSCPEPAAPGSVSCLAMMTWKVTVEVR